MKIVPLPADRAEQEKKKRSLKAFVRGYNVCLLGLAVAAIACLVGVVESVMARLRMHVVPALVGLAGSVAAFVLILTLVR